MSHNKIVKFCKFCENNSVNDKIRQVSLKPFLYDKETEESCFFLKFCNFHKVTDDIRRLNQWLN